MSNFNNQRADDFLNAAINDANQSFSNQQPVMPPNPNDPRFQAWLASYYAQFAQTPQQNFYHGGSSSSLPYQTEFGSPEPQISRAPSSAATPEFTSPTPQSIPESQPIPQPKPKKNKGKTMANRKKPAKEPTEKGDTKAWTPEEMKVLTECWIDASEDPIIGKDQSAPSFWGRIMETYNARSSYKRRPNQATSKWRKIKAGVFKFHAIWQYYDKNRASGEDDAQVMEEARNEYFNQTNVNFGFYECWLLAKDHPKFFAPSGHDVMGRTMQKRKNVVNVVDSDEEEEAPFEPVDLGQEELFGPDTYAAAPTKSKTQRTSTSSDAASSRSSASDLADRLEKLGGKKQALYDQQQQSLAMIREEERKRTMYTALSFMGSTTMTEEEQMFVAEAKRKVMAEYNDLVRGGGGGGGSNN